MVDSVWYLTPNSDNSQDMAYPEGNKPDAPIDILPAAVQDLAATATGTNTIQLDWTEVANATAYNVQRSPDNAIWSDIDSTPAPPYNAVNLVDGKQYWFRLFASNLNGWGQVSNTATAVTDEIEIPVAGDAVIFDDFERYASGAQLNNIAPPTALFGSAWVAPEVGTIFPGTVEISDQEAEAGTKSVMLRYAASIAPAGSNAAQTFRLASYYSSLTLEWDLFVPANLNAENIVSGQQLLRLWGDSESEQMQVGLNIHGESAQVMTAYAVKNEGGGIGSDWAHPINNFITAADIGTWINIKIKVDAPTSSSDGNIQIWRNDVSVSNYTYDNYNAGEPNGYKNGQIGGWCSGGYANQTAWYVDNFKVLTNNDAEWAGLTPNRFVKATATGGGTGSASDPWTLAEGMSNIAAGDILGVYPGVYLGVNPRPDLDSDGYDIEQLRGYPAFAPEKSGTASQPITIVAQYPASSHNNPSQYTDIRSGSDGLDPKTGGTWIHPTYTNGDGSPRYSEFGWPAFGAGFASGDHIHWIGMYSDENAVNNKIIEDCGLCTMRSMSGARVTQCKLIGYTDRLIKWNNWAGIRSEKAHGAYYADNHISNFTYTPQVDIANSAGIQFYYCEGYTVENNHIVNCESGVFQKVGLQSGTHLYGTVRFNHLDSCMSGLRVASAGDPQDNSTKTLFYQNLMTECLKMITVEATNLEATRDSAKWVRIYNNTHHSSRSSSSYAAAFQLKASARLEDFNFYNNILSQVGRYIGGYGRNSTYYDTSIGDFDFNCAHGYSEFALTNEGGSDTRHVWTKSEWEAQTGQESNTTTSDPQFVGGGDYRLQAGSPCEGTGQGNINMGCYITGDETIGIR